MSNLIYSSSWNFNIPKFNGYLWKEEVLFVKGEILSAFNGPGCLDWTPIKGSSSAWVFGSWSRGCLKEETFVMLDLNLTFNYNSLLNKNSFIRIRLHVFEDNVHKDYYYYYVPTFIKDDRYQYFSGGRYRVPWTPGGQISTFNIKKVMKISPKLYASVNLYITHVGGLGKLPPEPGRESKVQAICDTIQSTIIAYNLTSMELK